MPGSGKGNGPSGQESSRRARSFAVAGPLLRLLRAGRGWTQLEAAERAGLSERLLRKAEAGEAIESQSIAILALLYSTPAGPLTANDLLAQPASTSSLSSKGDGHLPAAEGRDDPSGAGPVAISHQPSSEAAQIEAIMRRWYDELWNQGRLEVFDDLVAPDGVLHAQGEELGREAARQRFIAMRAAFSDFAFEIDHLGVQGNVAVVRWHVHLTHVGTWLGEPPTGRRFVIEGSSWVRAEGGLLREGWDYWDQQRVIDAAREVCG